MNIKRILPVIFGMAMLSACAERGEIPPVSMSTSEKPTVEVTEIMRIPVTETEREYVNTEEVTRFLEAIKNGDVATVAMYSNSTEEAVKTWIASAEIESYELGECYKESYINEDGSENLSYYVLVKVNVCRGENKIFHSGEGLYRFYSSSAMSPIGDITADEKVMDMEEKRISGVCERYESLIGLDFSKGNADTIYDLEYAWDKLREFGYVGHMEIDSMESLNNALNDNLRLENIPWDYSQLAYDGGDLQEYQRVPRGGTWRYYGVKQLTDEKCVVEYYADCYGFAVSKTVEYTYEINDNDTICITSVKTIHETGLEEAVGAV
ncbi:MAG: hypothetical protein ACI4AQ_03550 [Lachnospiraceae bacterium]